MMKAECQWRKPVCLGWVVALMSCLLTEGTVHVECLVLCWKWGKAGSRSCTTAIPRTTASTWLAFIDHVLTVFTQLGVGVGPRYAARCASLWAWVCACVSVSETDIYVQTYVCVWGTYIRWWKCTCMSRSHFMCLGEWVSEQCAM